MVRAKRKSLGLSQEKLAERAGCDRQSINRVENAAYSPSLDRVFKLADALGMSLSDLFDEFDRVDSPTVAATGADRRDSPRSGQPPGDRAAS
ncbi:MAG TPA: helix-turn-helix transcriptional regulator [Mycobacteriales bacterium]|nr:helix-turn-helix transcriptional regulator [Mycobacteriales bacterium]